MRISWVLCALAACLAAGLFAATPGAAPVELRWGPPIYGGPLDSTGSGMELTTVDLNGDGLRDAVMTHFITGAYKDQPITVLLNKGHGHLEVATNSIFEGTPTMVQWARDTVVADFNGDGRPDLFFADTGAVTDLPNDPRPGHHNELALSTPAGKLIDATATLPQHSDFTHSAAAADVDGNGTVDLFLGSFDCCGDKTPAEILLNDGTGHFREATDRLPPYGNRPPGSLPFTASVFADVNADGAPDLVLGGGDGTVGSVLLLNDGHGFFRSPKELPPPVYGNSYGTVMDIEPVDVNADGAVDLLLGVTQLNPYYVGSRIQVLINDGGGHFRDESGTRMPQQPPVQSWPMRIVVEDFNGDGQPDFAIELATPRHVPSNDVIPFYLNRNGAFEPFEGAKEAPVNPRGPVGFVNGAGPYAMISTANGGRHSYYLSPQLVTLTAPTAIAGTSLRTGVRIAWHAVANATGYEVWRNGTLLMKTTSTTAVDTNAQRGRSYRYAIRALEYTEKGPMSAAVTGRRR